MHLAEGVILSDRFRLIRQLAQGGMGSVWLAHHIGLDVQCAVKVLHFEPSDDTVRRRFQREATAAAQLRCPNIVQILDYGVFDGTPYIAMEHLEGEDLAARLARRGRLTQREVVAIAWQISRALTKAHGAGIVHRDLKPENIRIVGYDDHEIVKVLDFGVAKYSAMTEPRSGKSRSTQTPALVGTPEYMSPEQASGRADVDGRSDLWSLAVIVFECFTGRAPFVGESIGDILIQIVASPLPVPSQVNRFVPAGFDAWWARAASRDPAHRFQTAKELVEGLTTALLGTPRASRSVSPSCLPLQGLPDISDNGPRSARFGETTGMTFLLAETDRSEATPAPRVSRAQQLSRPTHWAHLVAAALVCLACGASVARLATPHAGPAYAVTGIGASRLAAGVELPHELLVPRPSETASVTTPSAKARPGASVRGAPRAAPRSRSASDYIRERR